jgi:rhodanese-related sulfurtransferase
VSDRSIDELLEQARARLDRVEPRQALTEATDGDAILVDLREAGQRAADGAIEGAIAHSRLVLEWRADPDGEWRDERIADRSRRLILFCNHGYASSLAAATLRDMGFTRATDMIGGFEGWAAAGLPTVPVESSDG